MAKAIREGVVNGFIEREQSVLRLNARGEMYKTDEPQLQLEKRINYSF